MNSNYSRDYQLLTQSNQNLKDSQNELKNSVRAMYINDLNQHKLDKMNMKMRQLEEERKEIEKVERLSQIERENRIRQIQSKKELFFKEYHEVIKDKGKNSNIQSSLKSSIDSLNFLKPNEIIYETVNNNQNSSPNRLNYLNTNESSGQGTYNSKYLVASPYSNGHYNNIYSIHKIDDCGKSGYSPNNFFIDNLGSLNSIESKKKTFPSRYETNLTNQDAANYEYGSNNARNTNLILSHEQELKIKKLQNQLNYRNGLDFQRRNNQNIRNTPLKQFGPEISQYKWYHMPNDPRKYFI